MSFVAFVFVVVALAVGVGALFAAVVARRVLNNVGKGLLELEPRLAERAITLPGRLTEVRTSLENVNAIAEKTLWTLSNADERMDHMTADLTANRDASDRLRVRLINGQLSLARVREFIKLLMRLDKIRREFG